MSYAKHIHERKNPGFYAVVVNVLLILSLWRHCRAVNDTLGFAQVEGDWETEKQTDHNMYPHIGASASFVAGLFISGPVAGLPSLFVEPILVVSGALVGDAVCRSVAAVRAAEL